MSSTAAEPKDVGAAGVDDPVTRQGNHAVLRQQEAEAPAAPTSEPTTLDVLQRQLSVMKDESTLCRSLQRS
jgi:hypothetical protein